MKLRQELPAYQRRLVGFISAGIVLMLWIALTAPILPPLAEPDAAVPPETEVQRDQPADQHHEQSETPDSSALSGPDTHNVGPQVSGSLFDDDSESLGLAQEPTSQGPSGSGNLEYWRRTHEQPAGQRPLIPAVILPSPWQVLSALAYLHSHEGLVRSALASFMRITISFLLAALVAIPLAVLMGSFAPVRAWFEPFTGPLRYLPISAVTGLFILLFGIEEEMKIAFLFVGSVVYLIPICVEAIQGVDEIYLETAYTLGAKPAQVVLRVLVPAAWPSIFEACRVIYGVGWTYVILAELINAKYGLGYLISVAYKRGNVDQAYALVLIILLLGVASNEVFRLSGKRLFVWREA